MAPNLFHRNLSAFVYKLEYLCGFKIERLLGIAGPVKPLDASDALAVAICHQQQPAQPS
ncbi:crossover junction endodeoxyribonuclease RuvC [bacterium]|nr:crossover junction endodeoxyribonuclease RuvC [bacterium]